MHRPIGREARVASNKRERELARAKHQRQQARRAQEQARRRRITTIIAVIGGLLVVGIAFVWLVRGSNSTSTASATDGATSTASPSPSITGVTCAAAPAVRTTDLSWKTAPALALKPTGTYTMNLGTNCGQITIGTDQTKAPLAVNSMTFLSNHGFFDLTTCHRLTTGELAVLQCGDPKGTGQGGPGYSFADEKKSFPADGPGNYPAGTVAMANAGPNTNGSQFFIVYADSTLSPAAYTMWGHVTSGLDIVQYVAQQGVKGGGTDGPPVQPVVIEKATTTYKAAGS